MKFLSFSLFFALVSVLSANPRTYQYVSTAEFHDDISELDMHPDMPSHENMYSRLLNGKANEAEMTTDYWMNNAKAFVEEQLRKTPNEKKAKNIIMFLGDGMSHPSITAARVYMGGEEKKLAFEHFPYVASSKTYCVDKQVADSACTATAYLTGVKANYETIGLAATAMRSNCEDSNIPVKWTESIASWAMKEGKEAGFVTTTRVTHASPAGLYARIANRDWENDGFITADGCDPALVNDITEQLVHGETGSQLKVIFGGGSRNFIDRSMNEHGGNGFRTDGKNLINEWRAVNPERVYVNNKQSLVDLPSDVHQVLGLFSTSHLAYNLDVQRDGLQETIPSLTDMTLKAIDILSKDEDGYFLFVEGGRIDHGHHDNFAKYAIDETAEFSKAIAAALEKVDLEDTLVVVTADHGHVMTLAGYADRKNDIFGFAGTGQDNIPYMTLSYANGRGFYNHTVPNIGGRVDATTMDLTPNNFRFPATVPVDSESHGGEDVGIWAAGPWAHLFQGTIEQNVIPHVMAYASCIGFGLKMCD